MSLLHNTLLVSSFTHVPASESRRIKCGVTYVTIQLVNQDRHIRVIFLHWHQSFELLQLTIFPSSSTVSPPLHIKFKIADITSHSLIMISLSLLICIQPSMVIISLVLSGYQTPFCSLSSLSTLCLAPTLPCHSSFCLELSPS